MSIIYKYLTREILKYAGIVLFSSVGVFIAVDFFERYDNFMEAGVPFSKAVIFFIYKIPFVIFQMLPVCVLLSVLITFGLMNRNNELLALKAGGVSNWYLLKPVIWIGVFFSLILFIFSDIIVPITVEKANMIWLKEVRKRSAVISKEKNIWLKDARQITHIRYYDRTQNAVFGVTLYYFDAAFQLIRRVDAAKGVFKKGTWRLYDLMEQVLNKEKNDYNVVFHREKVEMLSISPENLNIVVKKSEEMSFKELLEYVRKIEHEGYDATNFRVDLYAKTAFPFVCLILSVIGTGIALKRKMKTGLSVNIASGISIAFFYWIFYSFCVSLGYGEMLPPAIAPWIANIVFSCFGIFNLLSAE